MKTSVQAEIQRETSKWRFWLKFCAYYLSIIPIYLILLNFYLLFIVKQTIDVGFLFTLFIIIIPILFIRKFLRAADAVESQIAGKSEEEAKEIFYNIRSYVNETIMIITGCIIILSIFILIPMMLLNPPKWMVDLNDQGYSLSSDTCDASLQSCTNTTEVNQE